MDGLIITCSVLPVQGCPCWIRHRNHVSDGVVFKPGSRPERVDDLDTVPVFIVPERGAAAQRVDDFEEVERGVVLEDRLLLAGNVVCAWLMGRSALAAKRHIEAGSSDAFYRRKIATARFFGERILPRAEAQALMIRAGSASSMAIGADEF